MRDEELHAVVARSTFPSQNVQSTPGSEQFWKLRCRKSVRRCGAKHISKSKVQETAGYGALLDVQMSFRVAGARDCEPCQSKKNVKVLSQFQLQPPLHNTTLHYTTFHCTTLQLQLQLHYTTLITPHYSTLHFTSRHCTQLHYTTTTTTLHYTTLITLHYTTVHYTPPNYTTLTTTTTTLHYTNYTTLHSTSLRSITLHYTTTTTTLRYTTLVTLHYTNYITPH